MSDKLNKINLKATVMYTQLTKGDWLMWISKYCQCVKVASYNVKKIDGKKFKFIKILFNISYLKFYDRYTII